MRESLDGGNVKGGLLRAHLDWFKLNHPSPGLAALLRAVSPETRAILEVPILPSNWYPFRAVIETDRAIAAVAGGDARQVIIGLGRHSARTNLTTSYRAFTRDHPHEFFRSAAQVHRQFEDFGRATYEKVGPTACRLTLGRPCYSVAYCWSSIGYFEEAALVQGAVAAVAVETECQCETAAACRFDIRWSEPPAP